MTSIQAFQQVMSPVSSVGQVTYSRDRHRTMGPPPEQKTVKKSGEKQEIRRYGYKAIASAPSLSTSQQNTLHAHARKKRHLSWPLAPYETSTTSRACRTRKRQCPIDERSKRSPSLSSETQKTTLSGSLTSPVAGCLSLAWSFSDFSFHAFTWAFTLAGHLNAVAWCFAPQFAHLGMT